jgi:hypothetical protein
MRRYFPFLRGKLNELMVLRELAEEIAESNQIIPIIEPVRNNANTRISLDRFIQAAMPFLFVCNPLYGDFKDTHQALYDELINPQLGEYDNWIPAFQLFSSTTATALRQFADRYAEREIAIVYQGFPASQETLDVLANEQVAHRIVHHVFVGNAVPAEHIRRVDEQKRVMVSDRFREQERNADYPPREFFTDMNTRRGNQLGLDFGDFSIVGDSYSDGGGPAWAVCVHHIHYHEGDSGPLDISHFISDRTDTTADPAGKTIEAVRHLVEALNELLPNDTDACDEYREMAQSEEWRGLGFLKRLAIQHHLELMLDGGIQLRD